MTPYSPLRRSTVEEQKQQGEVEEELFEDGLDGCELEVIDLEVFEVTDEVNVTDRSLVESTRRAFSSFISWVAAAFARLRSSNDDRNMMNRSRTMKRGVSDEVESNSNPARSQTRSEEEPDTSEGEEVLSV